MKPPKYMIWQQAHTTGWFCVIAKNPEVAGYAYTKIGARLAAWRQERKVSDV